MAYDNNIHYIDSQWPSLGEIFLTLSSLMTESALVKKKNSTVDTFSTWSKQNMIHIQADA